MASKKSNVLQGRRTLIMALLALIALGFSYLSFRIMTTEEEPPKPQTKGIFMYMYDFPDRSRAKNLSSLIAKIKDSGFNVVLPFVIHAGGLADYRSNIVRNDEGFLNDFRSLMKTDEDPLKLLVDEAHRNNVGVWAWVVGFRTNREVILEHPDWGICNEKGEDQSRGSFSSSGWYYLSPASEEARNYVKSYMVELVDEYGVDGINLEDDLGFPPGIEADFSEKAKRSFEAYLDGSVRDWPRDALVGGSLRNEWINWRARIISDFLLEVRDAIVKVNPKVILSADVSSSVEWNKQAMGVDWADWVQRGLVDRICPMLYHRDSGMPIRWIRDTSRTIVEQVKASNGKVSVLPCVGGSISSVGNMPGSEWVESIKEAMRGGVQGVVVFADVCVDRSDAWENLKNLFGEG